MSVETSGDAKSVALSVPYAGSNGMYLRGLAQKLVILYERLLEIEALAFEQTKFADGQSQVVPMLRNIKPPNVEKIATVEKEIANARSNAASFQALTPALRNNIVQLKRANPDLVMLAERVALENSVVDAKQPTDQWRAKNWIVALKLVDNYLVYGSTTTTATAANAPGVPKTGGGRARALVPGTKLAVTHRDGTVRVAKSVARDRRFLSRDQERSGYILVRTGGGRVARVRANRSAWILERDPSRRQRLPPVGTRLANSRKEAQELARNHQPVAGRILLPYH